ncbi:CidB/LrgB family autolysis modulator [Erwinia pyrifoliae]|uniref:CidB/LrgB family autolysis modulator n=1 Tax=Erwinia pyrifoliae TaxID=79967 RepID=A0ABY5XC32_ERWPY|nr:CidB/LrgB family autolysis modulator [Erwinia pyrifoliae]AUX73128.1 CidB/LrgB family autolysis modulator [Erwinia pyrifoliae]MCA8876590.1 CidB/LrgB family autolysis modulator [Erwinia pyrifoliae]MCT2386705.1 CidB/LrgB family autolysis modulator [Erwinia pyrifoliae]MCU8587697.1 CidB/LrgB family autolysis modulator [Erwinia pyrifoliae]UWS31495.1 CidB/LrgB family autolysis modulator [Erwinia pyrifoliae]
MNEIWWSLPLTVLVFLAARRLAAKVNSAICNPLLIAMAVIILLLLLLHMPYARYFQGSALLNQLLQPAVVALALPLYEQMPQIRIRWKSILSICFIGSLTAMTSGSAIALWLGATPQIAATLLPKSVTTPIAMAVSAALGGIPAISAVCVLIAGLLGAVFGHMLLNLLQVRSKFARGLAIGNASHALGTARAAEVDYQEGAFSSLALVLCGIITSLLSPFIFPLMLKLSG